MEPSSSQVQENIRQAAVRMDSQWLYQLGGRVFGPVDSLALLEALYRGEIAAETLVSCDEETFHPLVHFPDLQAHIPRAKAHQADLARTLALAKQAQKARLRKHLTLSVAVVLVGAALTGIALWRVQADRAKEVQRLQAAKDQAVSEAMARLDASLTIEPPLVGLVRFSGTSQSSKKSSRRGRRQRNASSGIMNTLSQEEVMQGLTGVFGGIRGCLVKQIHQDSASVAGQVILLFTITNAGRARDVSISDRILRNSPLRECFGSVLEQARWRSYVGEVRNVEYPITIRR
jgi:hypothetical protein